MVIGFTAVWFNNDAKSLYEQAKSEGLVSQPFNDFVKGAYHEAIDSLRMKAGKIVNMPQVSA